jgi:NMD protein affecting ribosome stability and mRNA decay
MSRSRCVSCGAPIKRPIGHSLCEKCWTLRLKTIADKLNTEKGNDVQASS